MKKNILITGAEGFIARNLSKFLNKKKFNLYGIGNKKFQDKISKKFGYKLLINKKIKTNILLKNFIDIDIVIHCAGSGKVNSTKIDNHHKNYLTTKFLIEYCKKLKKKPIIVFLSSYSVYADLGKKRIREKSKLKPSSFYGITKLKSEKMLISNAKKFKFDYKILRIASVYGNGLTKQLFFDACKKISKNDGFFYGTGNEVRDWLHINDLCSLVYKIINSKNDIKIINCGSGLGHSVKKILNYIVKNLNNKLKIKFQNKANSPKFLITNNNLAKKFKWHPKTKINTGLKDYIIWFKKNYG